MKRKLSAFNTNRTIQDRKAPYRSNRDECVFESVRMQEPSRAMRDAAGIKLLDRALIRSRARQASSVADRRRVSSVSQASCRIPGARFVTC
jgi:hypothetical protein